MVGTAVQLELAYGDYLGHDSELFCFYSLHIGIFIRFHSHFTGEKNGTGGEPRPLKDKMGFRWGPHAMIGS